jgi:hypothetical protein
MSWKLILDVDTPILNLLTIDGNLYFDNTRAISNLQSKLIWVRTGKIVAGEDGIPFTNQAIITLHGV